MLWYANGASEVALTRWTVLVWGMTSPDPLARWLDGDV